MDENCPHGSSTIAEVVAQGLEKVAQLCRERGTRFPSNLLLLGDNTVRELKNQFLMAYLKTLVTRRKFRMTSMLFLRKSHTHDRIDQVWGILSRRISHEDTLLDAASTIKVITRELHRPGVRQWIGSTTHVNVSKLDATYNWRDHWAPQGVKLEGGLLEDSSGNHAFIFLSRKGQVCFLNQHLRILTTDLIAIELSVCILCISLVYV